ADPGGAADRLQRMIGDQPAQVRADALCTVNQGSRVGGNLPCVSGDVDTIASPPRRLRRGAAARLLRGGTHLTASSPGGPLGTRPPAPRPQTGTDAVVRCVSAAYPPLRRWPRCVDRYLRSTNGRSRIFLRGFSTLPPVSPCF